MRQYASSPSQDESGHERPQGTAESASIAPRPASPPAALPPPPGERVSGDPLKSDRTRGERRQTRHRARDRRKDGGEDKATRTERVPDRRRREEKRQTPWRCPDQQRARRMAQALAEKLEHIGPAEKERVAPVPQREQPAKTPEPSVQSTRPRGRREPRRARAAPRREGGPEREHGAERADPTAKKGRLQAEKGRQARRASPEQVEGSMSGRVDAKTLQDNPQSPGPTLSPAKPEIGKEAGRRKARP